MCDVFSGGRLRNVTDEREKADSLVPWEVERSLLDSRRSPESSFFRVDQVAQRGRSWARAP
jgi:hypothetical protein